MTAPALSPIEEREVTRFGMFDAERFAEIVEHADDEDCRADMESWLKTLSYVKCNHCKTKLLPVFDDVYQVVEL